jgi:hypothetical protein
MQPLLPKNKDISTEEIESLCLQVITRLKDAFDLSGEVESSPGKGAWIGSDLSQWGTKVTCVEERINYADQKVPLERVDEVDEQFANVDESIKINKPETSEAPSILLYQVLITGSIDLLGLKVDCF